MANKSTNYAKLNCEVLSDRKTDFKKCYIIVNQIKI